MVDIEPLLTFHTKIIDRQTIHFDPKVRSYCCMPYKNKKRCPNYNKSETCPPKSKYLEKEVYENYNNYILYYAILDFDVYKQQMMLDNPQWVQRDEKNNIISYSGGVECVLYWQNSMKALLKNYIKEQLHITGKIDDYFYDNRDRMLLLACGSGISDYPKKKDVVPKIQFQSMESAGIHVFDTLKNNHIEVEEKNPQHKIVLVCLYCEKA